MRASYDSAGQLTLIIDFYNSLNALDSSQNYAFWGSFEVGYADDPTDPNTYCTIGSASLFGQHHVFSSYLTFYDQAEVSGYSGNLNFNRTASSDGRQIVLSATSPVLVNRNYVCLSYSLRARRRSTASNLYSRYDDSCNCWYVNPTLDDVGDGGEFFNTIWFAGYRPIVTGQRAAALRKCKKVRKAKKRNRCRKKANQLPK